MRKVLLLGLVACALTGCNKQRQQDELLWQYYKTFSFPPDQMDLLLTEARKINQATYDFVRGLRYLEQCDFDPDHNPKYLDSARMLFESIMNSQPDDYTGYLGLALAFTEYPDRDPSLKDTARNSQPKRDSVFKTAFTYYKKAHQLRPDLKAVNYYWARALFYRNENELSTECLSKFDSLVQDTTFFKAHERLAQFLSHYFARVDPDTLKKYVPNVAERVRYHFDQSLKGDSTWYETYEGIAKAKGIYAIYERVHFLEQAIRIARAKKSPDTDKLIAIRWSIFTDELANHDVVLNEMSNETSKSKSLTNDERYPIAHAYFYLRRYLKDSVKTVKIDSIVLAAKTLSDQGKVAPDFWTYMAATDEADSVYALFAKKAQATSPTLRAVLSIELAKWYWMHGKTPEAIALLKPIIENNHSYLLNSTNEIDQRLHGLYNLLLYWRENKIQSKIENL